MQDLHCSFRRFRTQERCFEDLQIGPRLRFGDFGGSALAASTEAAGSKLYSQYTFSGSCALLEPSNLRNILSLALRAYNSIFCGKVGCV